MKWYIDALKNWSNFSGRARRRECWFFYILNIIFALTLGFIDGFLGLVLKNGFGFLTTIYLLIIIVPSMAVYIRRLHDVGHSAWWTLIIFVPFIGVPFLLLFMTTDSELGTNQYGPNPKNSTLKKTITPPFAINPKEPR